MPNEYKIKNGLDINILGEADKILKDYNPDHYALKPTDFTGVFPKMMVKEGDRVKAGTPVFFDRYRKNIIFSAPVSGKITEIRRGAKRVLLEIRIEADRNIEYEDFGAADPANSSREEIIKKLVDSGAWPMIRQRPYSVIAEPDDVPKAIFIAGFDSAPLAPDYDFIIHNHGKEFQAGIDVLTKLTKGKVHLNLPAVSGLSEVFTNSKNVQINYFSGPHPAGNISVHANKVDPINKGDVIWYLRVQEVLTIGRLFMEGKLDTTRVIALTGSEVKKTAYYKTFMGASIEEMVKDNVNKGNLRYISGNMLTGTKIEKTGFVGYYDYQVTVIPEGDYYEFAGWAAPGFNKYSMSRTFLSWLRPRKKYRLDTNLHGGKRAFVMTGEFERVFSLDIYPMQLIKAIMVEDIDRMENLGIYEVDEEDFALCEFIDTSKTDIQEIIRNGLDLMRKEMM